MKFHQDLETCRMDWQTFIHINVVLIIFQQRDQKFNALLSSNPCKGTDIARSLPSFLDFVAWI